MLPISPVVISVATTSGGTSQFSPDCTYIRPLSLNKASEQGSLADPWEEGTRIIPTSTNNDNHEFPTSAPGPIEPSTQTRQYGDSTSGYSVTSNENEEYQGQAKNPPISHAKSRSRGDSVVTFVKAIGTGIMASRFVKKIVDDYRKSGGRSRPASTGSEKDYTSSSPNSESHHGRITFASPQGSLAAAKPTAFDLEKSLSSPLLPLNQALNLE